MARRPISLSALGATVGLAAFGAVRWCLSVGGLRIAGAEVTGEVLAVVSGVSLAALLLVTPAGAVMSRYCGELLGRGEEARARAVMVGATGICVLIGTILAVSFGTILSGEGGTRSGAAAYAFVFPVYLASQRAFLAFGKPGTYALAEVGGAAAFGGVFGLGLVLDWRTKSWLLAAITAHGAAVTILFLWWILREWVRKQSGGEWRWGWEAGYLRRYITYGAKSGALMLSGVAGSHIAVLIASARLSPTVVGYVGALIATVAPLSLLPRAMGSVLLPEFAFMRGRGEAQEAVEMARRTAFGLGVIFAGALSMGVLEADTVLGMLGVPESYWLTWTLLLVGLSIGAMATPLGQLINSTDKVGAHALASFVATAAAAVVGYVTIGYWGAVGVGVMRVVLSATLFVWRWWYAGRVRVDGSAGLA